MSTFLGGQAACGPSNAVKDVSSLIERDYGVQRDRFAPVPGSSAGPSAFRQQSAPGPHAAPQQLPQSPFDLSQLRSHLPAPQQFAHFPPPAQLAQVAPVAPAPQDWATGYSSKGKARAEAPVIAHGWGAEFDTQRASPAVRQQQLPSVAPWQRASPQQFGPAFAPQQPFYAPPPMHMPMPMPMHAATPVLSPPLNSVVPAPPQDALQFAQPPGPEQHAEHAQDKGRPDDVLARTAQDFVDSLSPEMLAENHKLADSKFLSLLRGLGDGSVVVEEGKHGAVAGSEVGQGAHFVTSAGADWAGDFLSGAKAVSNTGAASVASDGAQNYQDALLMKDGVPFTATRRKSVHFDEPVTSGVPRNLEEALASRTAVPGAGMQWAEGGMDEDFDEEALLHFNGGPRVAEEAAPENTHAAHEGWSTLQRDWDAWDSAPIEPYLFHRKNPYALGAPIQREMSPTTMGVLELEAAVQQDPRDADAWLHLGLKQQENEREEAAIRALTRASQLAPDLRAAYLALAVSYTNEGRDSRAHAALERWIELGGETEGGYASLSQTEGLTPAERQARIVERLIQIACMRPDDLDVDVQVALGVLFNATEDYAKAEDCFSAALAVRPEDWVLYNRLGATLANSGRSHEAIKYYHKALSLHPNFVRAQFNLGISYINLSQYRLAAQCILDAIRLQHADVTEGYGYGANNDGMPNTKGVTPDALWTTLRMACLHLNRPDLVTLANTHDLSGFPLEL